MRVCKIYQGLVKLYEFNLTLNIINKNPNIILTKQ